MRLTGKARLQKEVLLQRADEALGDAVALGLADEGGRALDAEEGDLVLEVGCQVVGAVVVAEREALGHVLPDAAEVAQDAPAHRTGSTGSKRLPARAAWRPARPPEQW